MKHLRTQQHRHHFRARQPHTAGGLRMAQAALEVPPVGVSQSHMLCLCWKGLCSPELLTGWLFPQPSEPQVVSNLNPPQATSGSHCLCHKAAG